MVPPRVSKLLTKTGPLMNLEKRQLEVSKYGTDNFTFSAARNHHEYVVNIVRPERQTVL